MKRRLARAVERFVVGAGVGALAVGLLAGGCATAPNKVSYVAVPHPDDEMQAWSLIEDTPEDYKVFIVMTRGEQTAFCASPGHDAGTGEAEPVPWPDGKWSAGCETARQNSFFGFLEGMGRNDSGLPSSFSYEGVAGPFDSLGFAVCRYDDPSVARSDDDDDNTGSNRSTDDGGDIDGGCISDLTAQVWTSALAGVVWFNLGDGDLSADEVEWAITTVRDNPSALGIDSSLPARHLIAASYWNSTHRGCFVYEHDDHLAAHEALRRTDYGLGEQIAATCASDPEVSRSEQVSREHFDDAFETSESTRVGAHVVSYGWLESGDPGYWAGDTSGQDELFHRHQTFWVQYGHQ